VNCWDDYQFNTTSCTWENTQTEDTIDPVAVCQNLTIQLDGSPSVTITADQIDNGSTDNCGIASISITPSTFTASNIGDNTVTFTVTDINGNIDTCTTTVTVENETLSNTIFELEEFKLYPVPFENMLYIKLPSHISSNEINITLFDIRGRLINTSYTTESNLIILNELDDLASGSYFIKITNKSHKRLYFKQIAKR
jgi:hypothetical protein